MDGSRCDASSQRPARGRSVLEVSQLVAWQFALHFPAPSCMRTLALWVKENSSAVEKLLRNYRFTYCWPQSPCQPCFDHTAPSEWSMRASPTVSAVGSITMCRHKESLC